MKIYEFDKRRRYLFKIRLIYYVLKSYFIRNVLKKENNDDLMYLLLSYIED